MRVRADDPDTLDIAVRSILESRAITGSIAQLVAERAFDHHFIGLFQYAAIRVGAEAAGTLLESLEARETHEFAGVGEELVTASSHRTSAQLYRQLRALLVAHPATHALAADADAWWHSRRWPQATLVGLRSGFDAVEREILELRYARRLREDEIAFVVGRDPDEVARVLACGRDVGTAALARGDSTQRGRGRGRVSSAGADVASLLLEAFALDPDVVPMPPRPRPPVLSVGEVVGGRYAIEALLGAGAFADVYRARDREVSGHEVALKILRARAEDARAEKAALRELQLLASVLHPSVVQMKDHGWHEARLWFVMPLYRGETLAARLRRGPLGRAFARRVFEPLAEALAAMHRAGVRHQDVKPENIFLASLEFETDLPTVGRILPVLLDLGVAAKDAELVLAGTPAYFAPEVAARFAGVPDPPPVGPKADVFSLALALRQALAPEPLERVPAGAVDAFIATRATHAPSAPTRRDLADLGPSFARWLAVRPDERPSADDFARELAILTRPAEKRVRRVALLRWALPVAVAVLATFGAVVFGLTREAELQRLEAAQAHERAAAARERANTFYLSLTEQASRRRELEANVARLEADYQSSRMTREELASRLARVTGELAVLADRERAQSLRLRQQADELVALGTENTRVRSVLEASESRHADAVQALVRERNRNVEADSQLARLSDELRASERALVELRADIRLMHARLLGANTPGSEGASTPGATGSPRGTRPLLPAAARPAATADPG